MLNPRCLRALFVILTFAMFLPGCVDLEELHALRDEAVGVRDGLDADIRQWQAVMDKLPEDDPQRPQIAAHLDASRTALETVKASVDQIDRSMAQSPEGSDLLGSVASVVPLPWRAPLILGGGMLAAALRARQLKAGLASVAKGLDIAMRDDEDFRKKFREHAGTFRTVQTAIAKRVVDETTRDGLMVRLPI